MLFNRLDIALKREDKGWETFDKLVNQGDLNRDEWKNQQIIDVEEKGTGNTDNSQDEGINGFDEEVKEYVLSQKESGKFYSKLLPLLEFLIPQYIKEGKKHLTISIGCSGGQHRSVTFVNKLAEDLKNSEVLKHINIYVSHREKELGHW